MHDKRQPLLDFPGNDSAGQDNICVVSLIQGLTELIIQTRLHWKMIQNSSINFGEGGFEPWSKLDESSSISLWGIKRASATAQISISSKMVFRVGYNLDMHELTSKRLLKRPKFYFSDDGRLLRTINQVGM